MPKNSAVFKEAVTHKSVDSKCNYERLEFLGDSILDATVSKHIFDAYRDLDEGELTQLRSKLVSRKNLNRLGKKLHLVNLIVSTFEYQDIPDNMYGNVLEALVGAIYLDGGQHAAIDFIQNTVISELDVTDFTSIENYKGKLLEWGNKEGKKIEFKTSSKDYVFQSSLVIENEIIASGIGKNKKTAEQEASKIAFEKLNIPLS